MKKLLSLLILFVLGINNSTAKPVSIKQAQKVAENFYRLNSKTEPTTVTLAFTEILATGTAAYYIFNINGTDGFVIVVADDAAHPIIGYSTEGAFVATEAYSPVSIWLKKRAKEVAEIQTKNLPADPSAVIEWTTYSDNSGKKLNNTNSTMSGSAIAPLVQSTWNQSPLYNALCPGGSVTGCVATAMAQIMRYWSYPAQGTGSSSYCDCSPNFSQNYGTLSADYGSTTYNWANMPMHVTASNNDVAILNYQCGVSVNMDYSPSGSGAWVCSFDNPVCAQNAYVNYFRYDPNTIQGLDRTAYTDPAWIQILQNDLNNGYPIQYVGWDPAEGGHTWVCDGYDQNNNVHMNWGWGGFGNGFYDINNLNSGNGDFSQGHQAVTGIVPIPSYPLDAGAPAILSPTGMSCANPIAAVSPTMKLQNYGSTTLTSCDINYQLDNGPVQTQSWTGSLGSFQSMLITLPSITPTAGAHTLTCYTSNPNGSVDGDATNDQTVQFFSTYTSGAAAYNTNFTEGFESTAIPGADWGTPQAASVIDWRITANAAATGSKSTMIDNMSNTAGNVSILESTTFDLAAMNSPVLSFKMAYQQKATANNDKLQVFVSTNCGTSWVQRWVKSGTTLPTVAGTNTNAFVPASTDFTTYTVNLVPFAASHNVFFRWVFTADANGPGNNIYLDDINISGSSTTGIQGNDAQAELSIYPNPMHDNLFVKSPQKITSVSVIDVLGNTVIKQNPANDKTQQMDISGLSSGVYFVKVISGDTQKLIKVIKD